MNKEERGMSDNITYAVMTEEMLNEAYKAMGGNGLDDGNWNSRYRDSLASVGLILSNHHGSVFMNAPHCVDGEPDGWPKDTFIVWEPKPVITDCVA